MNSSRRVSPNKRLEQAASADTQAVGALRRRRPPLLTRGVRLHDS
jgi:hypothetical protein